MCIDFNGYHSGGSSFVYVNEFWLLKKIVCIPTGISSALKEKKGKESQTYGFAPRNRFGSANWVGPGSGA